jgi:hypothetical protein
MGGVVAHDCSLLSFLSAFTKWVHAKCRLCQVTCWTNEGEMLAVKSIFSLKVFSLHTGNVVNPQIENLSYGCYLPSQYDMVPTETLTEQRKTIENCKKCQVTPKGKLTNTTLDLLAKKLSHESMEWYISSTLGDYCDYYIQQSYSLKLTEK